MKVVLDTNHRFILKGGVTRYIDHLLQHFSLLKPKDFAWEELNWPVTNYEYQQPKRALKTIYRGFVWGNFIGPGQLENFHPDLYHALDFSCVARIKCPRVLTLHDLGYLRVPDRFRAWTRWRGRQRLEECHKVNKLICVSQFTADEAMQYLGVPASRIAVVHLGCGFAGAISEIAAQAPAQPLPPEYFLFVGHLEPNKNLKLLRGVYELAAAAGRALPPLVIVGERWAGVAHEGTTPPDWIFLGRQSDAVLRYAYEHALAKVFPSRYEGFGLTVLEAMNYGCPVICSPVGSLPEVAGDAGIFVPATAEAYFQAMCGLLDHPEQLEEWRAKSRARARAFSWRKCAEETIQVYRDVLR